MLRQYDEIGLFYEPAAPMFNIYHVNPHETQNPDEFVTEICYPVNNGYEASLSRRRRFSTTPQKKEDDLHTTVQTIFLFRSQPCMSDAQIRLSFNTVL